MLGVKVRIKSNNGANNSIKQWCLCQQWNQNREYLPNAEKLFEQGVLSVLSACEFMPQVPPEMKAGRSVILKDLDTYLYDHSSDEIIGEIHQHNDWAKFSEVFKVS